MIELTRVEDNGGLDYERIKARDSVSLIKMIGGWMPKRKYGWTRHFGLPHFIPLSTIMLCIIKFIYPFIIIILFYIHYFKFISFILNFLYKNQII